ncbi:MAG TPA: aminotransferase class V-fold PLP-dependent enzyme [Vicinamibacterales bacterium]|nr:aminotransferase class V-fold PLP-dependent enzyme [Vicinamibacterales bacterium]
MSDDGATVLSRRAFGRLVGAAVLAARSRPGVASAGPDAAPGPEAGERFWRAVRDQFLMPADLAAFNAANLCPSPAPVVRVLESRTRDIDRDPSPVVKQRLAEERERVRAAVAAWLRVSPAEIVLTRNTSEANNLVSSGLDLRAGDEVVVFGDNHPSNHAAWRDKARRGGFTVRTVDPVTPHPGGESYVEAFVRATGPRTRLWALTHVTNSVGDRLPVAELCRAARERGVLTLVDGAQALGVLDVDLSVLQPDFFTGSGHKWPCAPRETGVLYVRADVLPRVSPSIVSLYPGTVGASRTLEAYGQRDEAAVAGLGEAIAFQRAIGMAAIEARACELARALADGLRRLDGVRLWTDRSPDRSAAIVTFQPGALDPARLARALYERDRIVCAARTGADRPGIRFSPHIYNLHEEVERAVAAVARYLRAGL